MHIYLVTADDQPACIYIQCVHKKSQLLFSIASSNRN